MRSCARRSAIGLLRERGVARAYYLYNRACEFRHSRAGTRFMPSGLGRWLRSRLSDATEGRSASERLQAQTVDGRHTPGTFAQLSSSRALRLRRCRRRASPIRATLRRSSSPVALRLRVAGSLVAGSLVAGCGCRPSLPTAIYCFTKTLMTQDCGEGTVIV